MKHCALVLCLMGLVGCGGSAPSYKVVPFTGTVKLNGEPLANAHISFLVEDNSKSPGGNAITDSEGKYEMKLASNVGGAAGKVGIVPGTYKVVFSKFKKPDGSDIPADSTEPPMNLGAMESIPRQYSMPSESKEIVKVPEGGGTMNFELSSM